MSIDIVVPTLGESVTEATVAKWLKAQGEAVRVDEPLVELETDKVTVEVPSPVAGVLAEISAAAGADVAVGAVLGRINEGAAAQPAAAAPVAPAPAAPAPAATPAVAAPPPAAPVAMVTDTTLSPAVRKLIEENRLDPAAIKASGKDGRLTKGDVLAHLEARAAAASAVIEERSAAADAVAAPAVPPAPASPREERVRMTRLRRMVAQRLKEAQNTAAMLTTFNEIDMSAANALRSQYRDAFEKRHGVRLGVMSIFVKACVTALKEFPAVNAEIDGDDIVYKNHYDIAIAVASPQGLVVPVVRDADQLSFAGIETAIATFAKRAREGALAIEDMQGGTFTITNGGVFGSLMSTPIINPPQSGILGMHKECVEDPQRILIET
jgi:2-oxoglutarate dehydrogenase E2 component (dihydrolipoamide succinyltransferase)